MNKPLTHCRVIICRLSNYEK